MTIRVLFDADLRIPRKRLSRMLRETGYIRVGQDEPHDLFVTSQARGDLSPLRQRRDKAAREGQPVPVMDEYEFYAQIWQPDFLANVLEERLDGPLFNKKILLVGAFSDQERQIAAASARKHHARIVDQPSQATLFVLGHRAYAADPDLFVAMLHEKARRPYAKIIGRAALVEKAEAAPGQQKKRKGPDVRRLYHGRPNPVSYPPRYVALDLEATSSHPNNKIIEIGMARFVNGEKERTYQSFVNPHEPLRPVIINLTGITDDQLKDAPDIQGLQKDILKFLGDDPVIGHSVQNDMKLLAENLNMPLDNNYVDTCRLAMTKLPEREKYNLRCLAADYGLTQATHRALDDAITSLELLETFRKLFSAD